jgi:hypothetical protein
VRLAARLLPSPRQNLSPGGWSNAEDSKAVLGSQFCSVGGRARPLSPLGGGPGPEPAPRQAPHDVIAEAQTPRQVPAKRPEQQKSAHDRSDAFVEFFNLVLELKLSMQEKADLVAFLRCL